MGAFAFMTENYFDSTKGANFYKSSQDSSYPLTNAYAKTRRSKVWRSAGYFNVVAGQNTIAFRETTGGSDLTATVTAAEYTTTASFITAVQTAMNAAGGGSTYTVTQNSNLKFVITSNGVGGGGVFEPRFATSTDMAAMLGFDVANITGALSYTADFLRICSSEWITLDLGVPTNLTAFALTGLRNSALKLSSSGTFKLQGSSTNAWTSPEYSQTLTYDSEVLFQFASAGLNTGPLRYWRVSFSDQNPNGYVEVGAMFLGLAYAPARGVVQFPLQSGFIDRSQIIVSEGGQTLAEVQSQTQDFSVDWFGLQAADIDEITNIFRTFGKVYPFFVAMDANAAFSSSASRMVKYVRFSQEPTFTLVSPGNFAARMTFREDV